MTEVYCHHALPPGAMIQEFRLIRVLGTGSFGIVYKAENKYFSGIFALKEFLPTELACRPEGDTRVLPLSSDTENAFYWARNKFLEEAKILWELGRPDRHPNIVHVQQFIEANETAYMVMDYEEGRSLSKILKERKTLPEEDLRHIFEPLLDGLERVHAAAVWHRDIKPSNILIRSDGSPVLIDFGAARRDMPGADRSVMSVYSPAYAAPEQFQLYGNAGHGPWTDIYALGATLYRAVTGTKPTNPTERLRGATYTPAVKVAQGKYSQVLLKAIDAALELKPDDRPQSIMEWRQLLNAPEVDDSTVLQDGTNPNGPNIADRLNEMGSTFDSPAKENEEPVFRDDDPSRLDISARPIDLDSALDGLTKEESVISSGVKEIKIPLRHDEGNGHPGGASGVLFSKWAIVAAIALISIIILLWMNIPKKADQEVDSLAKKAMEDARGAALAARDQARNLDAEKLNNYLQAQSHFDTGETQAASGNFREAEIEFQDARSLFEVAAKNGAAVMARSRMEKARQAALDAGVQPDAGSFQIGTLNEESGEKRFADQKFETAAESFTLALKLFEQAIIEIDKREKDSPPTACDTVADPNDPVGFVCAYFKACQRKDAESAVENRSDLTQDLAESLRREIENSEFYEIIDVSLDEHTLSSAEVYIEYTYMRRGQTPVSYVGTVYLEKNELNQWKIARMTQTIE